jgi:holo-[acyl-carrier protein] synthase
MILGTGIDIIEVERVAFSTGRNSGFRELVFSEREIEYCESKASPFQHYAARFAAKEAFLKAIGRGWDSGLALHEIEIVHAANGKPQLLLSGKTAAALESLNIRTMHVSLSHLKTYASAVVILES